jgi:hypothetical protein
MLVNVQGDSMSDTETPGDGYYDDDMGDEDLDLSFLNDEEDDADIDETNQ